MKDYYIGLDCGTSSVGWAVTDIEYNVLKFRQKYMWGAHLFEEAQTAQARRVQRIARRRLQRRKERIALAQELFAPEISFVDPLFFHRLTESAYLEADKPNKGKYSLFNDKDYTDEEFFKDYPTIYHLRKALMDGTAKKDPRLVYLAVHHILKNRGHFLFNVGEDVESVLDLSPVIEEIKELFPVVFNEASFSVDTKVLEAVLAKPKASERQAALLESTTTSLEAPINKLLVKTICGYKVKVQDLFDNEEYEELPAIEFRKASFEDNDLPSLEAGLMEDEYGLVLRLKALYDWSLLSSIIISDNTEGDRSVSKAKVDLFDRNKEDLKVLKRVIYTHCGKEEYEKFFHSDDASKGAYSNYIGEIHDGKKHKSCRRCSTDDFYKRIRGLIGKVEGDSDVNYILSRMEEGSFLNLLTSFRNGVIPYQLHLMELKKILAFGATFMPFLSEKDGTGLSGAEKVCQIMTYRIPYYVGPLGKSCNDRVAAKATQDKNSWVVRKMEGKVLPWNLEEMVDVDASAEEFIRRMTNKCVYFPAEDVIPKESLLYSKYMVLNDLNNVRINGEKLSVEQKQTVYEELFKNESKVTQAKLKRFVVGKGWYPKTMELTVTGIDGDFKSNLNSYRIFKPYFDEEKLVRSEAEEIIKILTIFSDDSNMARKRIARLFGKKLSDQDIKRISKLKFKNWGRFSQKFLAGFDGECKETGELQTIISALWYTQDNLMELLSHRYTYIDELEKRPSIDKLSHDVVNDLYVSPAVKRQIWQTLKIVDEIQKVMGGAPKKVFVETTRSEGEKKRTRSRKTQLVEAFKNLSKEDKEILKHLGDNFNQVSDNLDKENEGLITRRDKLYLYYSQMGRCMYSGEPIDIEDLDNTNFYDIDHIYPYSKSDDDSLTNRVLVKANLNRSKSDDFPLPEDVRNRMSRFWKMLLDKNLINKEKYSRLTRTSPLTEDDLQGFINRQLVETSQSTKETCRILKQYFGDETKIVYSKAGKVSEFRKEFKIYKARSVNDLHHAKDAYLNIVVGNVLDTKYSSDFFRGEREKGYRNISTPFKFNVDGAWVAKVPEGGKTSLETVLAHTTTIKMEKTILHTKQTVCRTGQLFDLMLVNDKEGTLPPRTSDPVLQKLLKESEDPKKTISEWTKKYGGYNNLATCCFSLVKHLDKKKSVVSFVPISKVDSKYLLVPENLRKYCENDLGMRDVEIIRAKIPMNTLIYIDGFPCRIAGKSNGGAKITVNSDVPLYLSNEEVLQVKKIEKVLDRSLKDKSYCIAEEYDSISLDSNTKLYLELIEKSSVPFFSRRAGAQNAVFASSLEKWNNLTLSEQCKVLAELLKYFGMSNGQCDLSMIGGAKQAGTITYSSKIDLQKKTLVFVDQSITGLFEKKKEIK